MQQNKKTNKFKQLLSNFEPWNDQYFKQLCSIVILLKINAINMKT